MTDRQTGIWSPPPGIDDAELIARGGFATVYRGWQRSFHRQVAVKVLAADATEPGVRARFEREVRAMGAVSDHPNVVPVYDAGVHEDRPYLVMPYLAGGSLDDERRRGPLSPSDVIAVGIAVADALDAAHAAGLLHRDVKPANILRTAHGDPKLADFGVARFADATATHGQLALTVAYAAPELLRGEPATVASDVYSLGATLHALLRGAPPFEVPDGGAPVAMAMRIVSDDPPDLRAAGVPAALAGVVDRAMAKDPAARHPSAAALRDALAALGTSAAATEVVPETAIVAGTAVVPEPVVAPPRPSSRGWAIALVAVVVAAVIGVAAWAALRDQGHGAGTAATSTTAAPTTTATTVATSASTTSAPAVTVPATVLPTTAPATSTTPVDAARQYFAVLDGGDIDGGWARLSPRYQEASGHDSYYGFWSTISSVDVLDAAPGDGADSAVVRVRYTRDDGTSTTETNTLRFVSGDDGTLLIDSSS